MGRLPYSIPALVLGFSAFVLLVLSTVSLPSVARLSTPFDVVRADRIAGQIVDATAGANSQRQLESIKLGLWGYCTKAVDESRFGYCSPLKYDYTLNLTASALNTNADNVSDMLPRSVTRGLLVTAVALAATFVTFFLGFVPSVHFDVFTGLAYLVSMLLALIAFIIQIVLFVYARVRIHNVYGGARVMPGPTFYLTLVSIPLLFGASLAMCVGCLRERKNRKIDAEVEKVNERIAEPSSTSSDRVPLQS